MQNTTTRIDEVVDALLADWRTALPDVQILDGPRAAQGLARDVLQVGVGNDQNAEAYSSETEPEPGLSGRLAEIITVNCEMTTWSGNHKAEMAPLRTKLAGYLGIIDSRFRANQQFTGSCDRIFIGPRARWYGLQSDTGAGMGVEFSVTARAWL